MVYKIENITPEYYSLDELNKNFLFCLKISSGTEAQYGKTQKIKNKRLREILEKIFLQKDTFPEYITIAYNVLNYLNKHNSKEQMYTSFIVRIVTDETDVLAKDHVSTHSCKVIHLFSMFVTKQKNGYHLNEYAFNIDLVTNRILCTNKNPIYEQLLYVCENSSLNDIEQNVECSICLSVSPHSLITNKNEKHNDNLIITSCCKNKFHLKCLQNLIYLQCPLCREDLKSTLIENNVSVEEIDAQTQKSMLEKKLEEHRQFIMILLQETQDFFDLSNVQMLKICAESLRLNGGDISLYVQIMHDLNSNASKLYYTLDKLFSKKENTLGIFYYKFDTAIDFIKNMIIPSKSHVKWTSVANIPLNMQEKYNELVKKTKDTEYIVGISIDDSFDIWTVDRDKCGFRPDVGEICLAIMRYQEYRLNEKTSDNYSPNIEYKWAKSMLKIMSKKNKYKYKNNNIQL